MSAISFTLPSLFTQMPESVQREQLELIERVVRENLHCEKHPALDVILCSVAYQIATRYFRKLAAPVQAASSQVTPLQQAGPARQVDAADKAGARIFGSAIQEASREGYQTLVQKLGRVLTDIYHDPDFVTTVMDALQTHLLGPNVKNLELCYCLCDWVSMNAAYLPLGEHLLEPYIKDMKGETLFAKCLLFKLRSVEIPEAYSEQTIKQVRTFLGAVGHANSLSVETFPVEAAESPTAVVLSVENGAGGHTAPERAMAARLKERGYRVEVVKYDKDLPLDYDRFHMLGITFADGTPMTEELYVSRWKMPKHNKDVARIVGWYAIQMIILYPDFYRDGRGAALLHKIIRPLNPRLIVTTMAYHWSWRSLAFRLAGVKTMLVASDVFFHRDAMKVWLRQRDLPAHLHQLAFTTMTDDLALLKSMADAHDEYWTAKHPGKQIDSLQTEVEALELDEQITTIGAPINPSFDVITSPEEIVRLREKWAIPDDVISVCISRGKLGFTVDLEEALEGYRSDKPLGKKVVLHVVCGENQHFYGELQQGKYSDLCPDITIRPHPLVAPKDFAEIRAISLVDDIKAGGASTFEGWYLISRGSQALLLLTPGPELWWEKCNCWAMEKWGVGELVKPGMDKTETLRKLAAHGLRPITHTFPDWRPAFDALCDRLWEKTKDWSQAHGDHHTESRSTSPAASSSSSTK